MTTPPDGQSIDHLDEINGESRKRYKRRQWMAIAANTPCNAVAYCIIGPLMILCAHDVFHFTTYQSAAIVSFLPLTQAIKLILLPYLTKIHGHGWFYICMFSSLSLGLMLVSVPVNYMSYGLFFSIVFLYSIFQNLGLGTVWQPMMQVITSAEDRIAFFSRMRFCVTAFQAIFTVSLGVYMGHVLEAQEYKSIIAVACGLLIYFIFFLHRLPKVPSQQIKHKSQFDFWRTSLKSCLQDHKLQKLIILTLLVTCQVDQLFLLYLKTFLEVPSSHIVYLGNASALGATLAFYYFGFLKKNAENVVKQKLDYEEGLIRLMKVSVLISPLLLTVYGFNSSSLALGFNLPLFIWVFLKGFLTAGAGVMIIAATHQLIAKEESITYMNIVGCMTAVGYFFYCGVSSVVLNFGHVFLFWTLLVQCVFPLLVIRQLK